MKKVAVIWGGRSLERQVSLRSAFRVSEALQQLGYHPQRIELGKQLVAELLELDPEVAFLVAHGSDGENGTLQMLLETAGIPYSGSPPLACAFCVDKTTTKFILAKANIPTPKFVSLPADAFSELGANELVPTIERKIGLPLVVKPAEQGSALGVAFAYTSSEIPTAILRASSYGRSIMLETAIDGRDLAVAVINGQPFPIVEAIPSEKNVYDFQARYEIGECELRCPAEVDEKTAHKAQRLACSAFENLGCRGAVRVDMLLDRATNALSIIEVDTVPGLTTTSLLPRAAEAAGISFSELIKQMLPE